MKVVCFDFDGTLADSFPFIFKSFGYMFEKYLGIKMDQSLFDKISGPDEKGILIKVLKDKYSEACWDEYLKYYDTYSGDSIKLFPGIKEMLISLKSKGVHLVFLTGRSKETATISLKKLGIYDLFEGFYAGSRTGCVKDILLAEVAKDFKLPITNVLYIGDSRQDVLDAKKAGCDLISVLFSNPQWWDEIKKMNPIYATNNKELEDKILNWYAK
jgi:Predicted phosphatases